MSKVSNGKAENQYYGKFLECCTTAAMNNSEEVEYEEDYIFTEDEQSEFFEEAEQLANHVGKTRAIYIGNKTSNERGDIYLPDRDEYLEIKRVSSGTGTYYNTSIYYLSKFGHNGTAFHDGENVPLYALPGNVGAARIAPTCDLIDLVDENDAVVFRPAQTLCIDCVVVDELIALLGDDDFTGFLNAQLSLLLMLWQRFAEQTAQIDCRAAGDQFHGAGLFGHVHFQNKIFV